MRSTDRAVPCAARRGRPRASCARGAPRGAHRAGAQRASALPVPRPEGGGRPSSAPWRPLVASRRRESAAGSSSSRPPRRPREPRRNHLRRSVCHGRHAAVARTVTPTTPSVPVAADAPELVDDALVDRRASGAGARTAPRAPRSPARRRRLVGGIGRSRSFLHAGTRTKWGRAPSDPGWVRAPGRTGAGPPDVLRVRRSPPPLRLRRGGTYTTRRRQFLTAATQSTARPRSPVPRRRPRRRPSRRTPKRTWGCRQTVVGEPPAASRDRPFSLMFGSAARRPGASGLDDVVGDAEADHDLLEAGRQVTAAERRGAARTPHVDRRRGRHVLVVRVDEGRERNGARAAALERAERCARHRLAIRR